MKKLDVEIVTPERMIHKGSAYMVVVPGQSGELGFLPGHVPYIVSLGKGEVKLSDSTDSNDSSAVKFSVDGGYVQLSNDKVIVLAEHAKEISN